MTSSASILEPLQYAGVVTEVPLTKVFHYRIPRNLHGLVKPGMIVKISFGRQKIRGFVVSLSAKINFPEEKIKDISGLVSNEDLATPEIMELSRWLADYYHCGWGEVLAAAIPAAVRKGSKTRTRLHIKLSLSPEQAEEQVLILQKKAPRQAQLLTLLLAIGGEIGQDQAEERMTSVLSPARALQKKGMLELREISVHRELLSIVEIQKNISLSQGQETALREICSNLDAEKYTTFMLHGATASGKTEVYLRALEHCLAQHRTGIVLVPEISLTPQTVERFRSRVGKVAVLHSQMTLGERAEAWRGLQAGDIRVAIGARSAIFAPLSNLGLIVVDEEHERTFKQENTPRYNARDVAVVRASKCKATVILGSATPCLESFHNAKVGKYKLLSLPERVTGGELPAVEIVDMRSEWAEVKQMTLISRKLQKAMATALERKEQIVLLLNRRGFNTFVHCLYCKATISCPDCDISLTYHQAKNKLQCHYCGYYTGVPETCPDCGMSRLRFAGSGTERAEDVVGKLFPGAALLRMDSDTMTGLDKYAESLCAFARQEFSILLGTQMIAKGLDFPNVTLIGVLNADASINLPDFRAQENTFQLVTQVLGRSGRGKKPGLGIVQAYDPDHYAVQLAARQDYNAFAQKELVDRKAHNYPPFGKLARILIRGPLNERCANLASQAAAALRKAAPPLAVLGPAPCSISRIQANFRYHLLIKADSVNAISRILAVGLKGLKIPNKVRLDIDIDPCSML